jgi:ribonuclease HI
VSEEHVTISIAVIAKSNGNPGPGAWAYCRTRGSSLRFTSASFDLIRERLVAVEAVAEALKSIREPSDILVLTNNKRVHKWLQWVRGWEDLPPHRPHDRMRRKYWLTLRSLQSETKRHMSVGVKMIDEADRPLKIVKKAEQVFRRAFVQALAKANAASSLPTTAKSSTRSRR